MKFFYTHQCGFGLILLFIFFSTTTAKAQNTYKLSGQVTDTTGQAIPGVHIQRINTTNGATTDFDGNYNIEVTGSDRLSFTYLGYQAQTIAVNNRRLINVQLSPSTEALDEVVINAGYYRVKDRERTGSIEKVTSEDIELQPVTNPIEALQGRMAGVEVVQSTGVPGAAPTIRIRGQSSLRTNFDDNGNLPLYIIDGMPINSSPIDSQIQLFEGAGVDPLNTLDLSNIESIEVLKDADATAIYGSRGANGVVLITTKSGQKNQGIKVSTKLYTGMSRVDNFLNLLNTQQYLKIRKQAFENDGVEPNEYNAFDLVLWDENRYTDWQKELFGKTAELRSASFNISNANETTSYIIGASYQKQGMVFPGDFSYEKKTFNLNLNHQSKDKKFKLNLSANYGLDDNDLFNSSTFVSTALTLAPNAPRLYNDDGSLNWEDSTWSNPLATLENEGKLKTNNLISNLGLTYRLSPSLSFKSSFGYTHLTSEENIQTPIESYDPAMWDRVTNRSQYSDIRRNSWIVEPQIHYRKTWGQHHFNTIVGATFQENKNTSLTISGRGYIDRNLIGNLEAADQVSIIKDRDFTYKYSAIFARLAYDWKEKYYLNLTGRRDGSSRFGPDKRFANFGAIGAAWIFTEENFFDKYLNWLSFGKIRGSYGTTGNDQIGDYRYLDAYEATPGPEGLYPTQLTNNDFSWETNKKLEAALELSFLNNRIHTEIAWYRNRSSNQLVGYPLPAITGFSKVEANLPATVENKGWELGLSAKVFQKQSFQWNTSLNMTIPSSKLVAFPDIEETAYANTYRVGQALSLDILYQFEGVDPDTGYYTVKDVNEDGSYDYDDRLITKDLGRKFFGGVYNKLNYKNFSLSFLFEFVKQNGRKTSSLPPGRLGNNLKSVTEYGSSSPEDLQAPSQSINAFLAFNRYAYNSEFSITDASFIRLKTLSLGYEISNDFTKNIGLSQFKLFVHAQNLLTITDYEGLDPQSPGSKALPSLQSLTGGLQLTF
ncbi:MAG: SusC/RagA family TonB-linked outer membrane protein [Psychroflexus halocasei]